MAAGATLTAPEAITATTDVEGYEVAYADGTYSVVEKKNYVAQIGEQGYESLAAAITDAKAGETITLVADVTEDVTVSKNVTIDGAGKTYTGKMTLKADATIKNVNFDGNGYNGYAVETRGANYVTIEDCTAKNYGFGFVQLASGTALTTVKNVTVSNMNYGVKVDYSNAVVLENVDITAGAAAVLNSNYGEKTITIKNSTLNILGTWKRNDTTKTTYVFEGENTVDQFKTEAALDNFKLAEGATLTAPEGLTVSAVEEGYVVVYADGMYKAFNPVVMVGEAAYPSIQAAIDAVPEGEAATIKVAKDHNITGYTVLDGNYPMSVVVSGGKKITLDLNGNTVTYEEKLDFTLSSVFYVYGSGSEFSFVDSSEDGNGVLDVKSHRGVVERVFWSGTYGVMKFYSGTYYLRPADENGNFGWMFYNNIGDSYFYGGTYIMSPNGYDMLGCQGSGVIPDHKHNIYGGKFNRNVAKITRNVNIAEGHVCQQNGDMWEVFYAVAQVGDKYYASLAEAVEAAPAEGTVTVVNNATGAGVVINKDVTIDFNGKTYTFDGGVGSKGTETIGLQIKKDNNVTLKNGTLTSTGDKVKMLIQNYANLDVVDMNLNDETEYIQYVLSNNYGKTQILGNTNITTDAVAFDSYDYTKYYPAPAVVIVKTEGTIEGEIEKSEMATIEIYSGTYTMNVNDWCATGYATVDNHDNTWTVESLYVGEMVIDYNAYGVDDDFENQNVKTVGKLTYKRKFKESVLNKWQTLYVPFEVPVEELVASEDYEIAYLNGVHAYDRNEDSVIDSLSVEYIKIKSGTLYANTPYMIKPKKSEALELELVLNRVTLYATDDASQNKIECASAFVEFQFGGTYEFQYGSEILDKLYGNRLLPSASPMLYYAGGGEWWNGHGQYDTMKFYAFDLYFALKAKANSPYKVDIKSESVGSRVIGEENEDGTTTIYDVPEEMDVNGMIFDLSGRRVNETEKGIYIQNGKKVLVK